MTTLLKKLRKNARIYIYYNVCLLGIPYALHQAGFGLGMVLLIVVAILTDYSLILMVRSGHLSGEMSYQGLMRASFGRPGFYILTALQFIYPFIGISLMEFPRSASLHLFECRAVIIECQSHSRTSCAIVRRLIDSYSAPPEWTCEVPTICDTKINSSLYGTAVTRCLAQLY